MEFILGADALADKAYEYTKASLERLLDAGAYPDMVQIGNEIGCGLLWDYGTMEHPENIVKFLNRGMDAVRDVRSGKDMAQIMLHIENGGDTERTEHFFSTLIEHGLHDFDVIGLSYYPYWSGPYEKLQKNMKNIAKRFQKPVVVAETAFPYTDESTNAIANVVGEELTMKELGLRATPQNQRSVLEEVIRTVDREPNGYGVFYWEPVWYSRAGVGVMKGMDNEWENFWKITFPMISPLILVNSVYTVIDLFTNETNEMMTEIKNTIFKEIDYGYGSAMAWIYFICIVVVLAVVGGLISRHVFYYDER